MPKDNKKRKRRRLKKLRKKMPKSKQFWHRKKLNQPNCRRRRI